MSKQFKSIILVLTRNIISVECVRVERGATPKHKKQSGLSSPAKELNLKRCSKCDAVLAQLVERDLAKVEVTSSSLVYRSKY